MEIFLLFASSGYYEVYDIYLVFSPGVDLGLQVPSELPHTCTPTYVGEGARIKSMYTLL